MRQERGLEIGRREDALITAGAQVRPVSAPGHGREHNTIAGARLAPTP